MFFYFIWILSSLEKNTAFSLFFTNLVSLLLSASWLCYPSPNTFFSVYLYNILHPDRPIFMTLYNTYCGWDLADCGWDLAELWMISCRVWMRSIRLWMRSSRVWMRPSRGVRASDCRCRSCKSPGFDPNILRHSGIWGAAEEAVLNKVHTKNPKIALFYCVSRFWDSLTFRAANYWATSHPRGYNLIHPLFNSHPLDCHYVNLSFSVLGLCVKCWNSSSLLISLSTSYFSCTSYGFYPPPPPRFS
jgi:hypothetical protein